MSSGERSQPSLPADAAVRDKQGRPAESLAEEQSAKSESSQQDEHARRYYEALAQRINDAYAQFTPEDMELLKDLGWG